MEFWNTLNKEEKEKFLEEFANLLIKEWYENDEVRVEIDSFERHIILVVTFAEEDGQEYEEKTCVIIDDYVPTARTTSGKRFWVPMPEDVQEFIEKAWRKKMVERFGEGYKKQCIRSFIRKRNYEVEKLKLEWNKKIETLFE